MNPRTHARMVAKSFAEGWITDPETRERLRREMENMVLDPKHGPRDKLNAIKALLAAERNHLSERELELKERVLSGGTDDDSILELAATVIRLRQAGPQSLDSGLPD